MLSTRDRKRKGNVPNPICAKSSNTGKENIVFERLMFYQTSAKFSQGTFAWGADRRDFPRRGLNLCKETTVSSNMAVVASDAEISKAKQFRKVATLLQNVGNKVEDSYLRLELDGRINGEVGSKTVQAWHRDLLRNLENVSTPPKVSKSKFRDARKLFIWGQL